ncbi:MAG: hypothetical protein ABSH45_09820, partial [Bryobacteraceae bacterium]
RRAASAAASPAGPPPTMNKSVAESGVISLLLHLPWSEQSEQPHPPGVHMRSVQDAVRRRR